MTTMMRIQYTEEFKREAVKLITEQGYKVSEAARNLDVNVGLLGRCKYLILKTVMTLSVWLGFITHGSLLGTVSTGVLHPNLAFN